MWSSESGASAPGGPARRTGTRSHISPRGNNRRADIMGATADDMDKHRADEKTQESSTVRQKTISPPVSPVGAGEASQHAREARQQAQRFTAKQHCGAAEGARVVTPTPTSVVMLRRHFSKQRQTHRRDAHDGVPPSPLDPLVFAKQTVEEVSATTRASPRLAGCLASTRGRLLHFQVLDEPLKAAQRRLALALVAEKHPFDLDNTCLRLILGAISSAQQDGDVSVAQSDAHSAEAPRTDPSGAGAQMAHTNLTMQQVAGDLMSGVPNRADPLMPGRPEPTLLLP